MILQLEMEKEAVTTSLQSRNFVTLNQIRRASKRMRPVSLAKVFETRGKNQSLDALGLIQWD